VEEGWEEIRRKRGFGGLESVNLSAFSTDTSGPKIK